MKHPADIITAENIALFEAYQLNKEIGGNFTYEEYETLLKLAADNF